MCSHNLLPNASSLLANSYAHTTNTNTNTTAAVYNKLILQPSQSYAYTQNPVNTTTILNNSIHHSNIHTNTTTNNNNKSGSIYEAPSTFCSLLGRYLTSSLHREINDYGSLKATTDEEVAEQERLILRVQVSMT